MDLLGLSRIKIQLKKVFWITVAWMIISFLMFLSDYTIYIFVDKYPEQFDLSTYLITVLGAGLAAGILGGSVIVFLMEDWLRTKPYGLALLYILVSYFIISSIINICTAYILFSMEDVGLSSFASVKEKVSSYFFSVMYLKGLFFWLLVTLGTIIVLLVNDKYGPGVFLDFLKGKYFHPRKEERIFMFLDMRSSTTIAEKLGEEKYFEFLKKVFSDITPSIIYSRGEIYQYVGDEIVISWKVSDGKQRADCISCFYHIQDTLAKGKPAFLKKFGASPEFKAGLHCGKVIAGEIGVVKRDITFSGDVLNTAARIQAKCNEFGVNILLSKFLLDKLSFSPNDYAPRRIGDMFLRGKEQAVVLYTL